MGAMKDFLLWSEEKGYVEYIDMPDGSTDWINTSKHPGDSHAMGEYLAQRDASRHLEREQLILFDDDDEDLCDETQGGVIMDDGEDMELPDYPMGQDYTMPLFDENGGLTAEAFDLLYKLEQDGGFT